MIKIKNLHKTYNSGKQNEFHALKGVSLEIKETSVKKDFQTLKELWHSFNK